MKRALALLLVVSPLADAAAEGYGQCADRARDRMVRDQASPTIGYDSALRDYTADLRQCADRDAAERAADRQRLDQQRDDQQAAQRRFDQQRDDQQAEQRRLDQQRERQRDDLLRSQQQQQQQQH